MHRQRIWILVGVAIVLAGYFLPWAHLAKDSYNAFNHVLFRPFLIALLGGAAALAVFGKRRARVAGPALVTLVVVALVIAAFTTVLAYALARSSQFFAWRLGWGILVTLVGCGVLVVAGALAGRNDFLDPER